MATLVDNGIYSKELELIKDILSSRFPYETRNFGKLLRSRLGILGLKLCGEAITGSALKYLASVELIHNASLLHDDIIDDSDLRRGVPNIKSVFNNKTALLYGNVMITEAIRLVGSLGRLSLIELVNETIAQMCRGELLQQTYLYKIPSFSDYVEKSRLKTAVLFKSIFSGLSILFNNPKLSILEEFGENFGIAYQIKNDLENISKDSSDIENGVYTLPVIFSGSTDITNPALEKTVSLIDNYREDGENILLKFDESIYRDELIRIVNNV